MCAVVGCGCSGSLLVGSGGGNLDATATSGSTHSSVGTGKRNAAPVPLLLASQRGPRRGSDGDLHEQEAGGQASLVRWIATSRSGTSCDADGQDGRAARAIVSTSFVLSTVELLRYSCTVDGSTPWRLACCQNFDIPKFWHPNILTILWFSKN